MRNRDTQVGRGRERGRWDATNAKGSLSDVGSVLLQEAQEGRPADVLLMARLKVVVELAMRRALGREVGAELACETRRILQCVVLDPLAEEGHDLGLGALNLVVATTAAARGGAGRGRQLEVGDAHDSLLDLAQHRGSDRGVLAKVLSAQDGELAGRREERAQVLHLLLVEIDTVVARTLGIPAIELVLLDAELLVGPLAVTHVAAQTTRSLARHERTGRWRRARRWWRGLLNLWRTLSESTAQA